MNTLTLLGTGIASIIVVFSLCIIEKKISLKRAKGTIPAPSKLRQPTALEIETFKDYIPTGGIFRSKSVKETVNKWLNGLMMADGCITGIKYEDMLYDISLGECNIATEIYNDGLEPGEYLEIGTKVKAYCVLNDEGKYVIQAVYKS